MSSTHGRAFVTGATGFIGRALVRRLHDAGREVVALGSGDGDIRQRATLARFADAGVRSVSHLAGRSYVPDSWADPAAFLKTNFLGTLNALELCRATGARFVSQAHTSTELTTLRTCLIWDLGSEDVEGS